VPPASDVEVAQLVDGSVAVHRVVRPEINATVPVASLGRPDSDRVELVPYATLGGVALAVNDVAAKAEEHTPVGAVIWLVSMVIAPFSASARPGRMFAPVTIVILVSAMTLP
jgi:hypothetical protein